MWFITSSLYLFEVFLEISWIKKTLGKNSCYYVEGTWNFKLAIFLLLLFLPFLFYSLVLRYVDKSLLQACFASLFLTILYFQLISKNMMKSSCNLGCHFNFFQKCFKRIRSLKNLVHIGWVFLRELGAGWMVTAPSSFLSSMTEQI